MDNRTRIKEVVERHPGISFSALRERTGLANGVLQHHLQSMEGVERRSGAIVPRDYCRNCSLSRFCTDTCLRNLLRDSTKQIVVEGLADGKTQTAIADALGLDRSTVSYHVQQLEEHGVLDGKHPVTPVRELLSAPGFE